MLKPLLAFCLARRAMVVAGFVAFLVLLTLFAGGNAIEKGCLFVILYVLVLLLFPAAHRVREKARQVREQHNQTHTAPPSADFP